VRPPSTRGYKLDTHWKSYSTARERQRGMLGAGWLPVGSTGSTTPHIKWGRTLPGALKQTLIFACTPSDVRHWLHEQSNLLRQDRDAVERLTENGRMDAIIAGTAVTAAPAAAPEAGAANASDGADGGGGGRRGQRQRGGIDRALAQFE